MYEEIRTDDCVQGFLVSFGYWDTYYVEKGNLFLGDSCIMMKNEFAPQSKTWVCDKNICWGSFTVTNKVIKIEYAVTITTCNEKPEWVGKTELEAEKEIEEYRKEKSRNKWWRKALRLIFVGK